MTGAKGDTGATGPEGPAGKGTIGGSIAYAFDPATGFGNPGPGELRLNSVNPSEVTGIFINETDADGANVESWLDTGVESTGSPPSYLMIRSESETDTFYVFEVKALVFDVGEYSIFEIKLISGQGGFSEGEQLALHLSRTGNDGTDASLPYTDYGLVSALPSSPSVGDRCIFEASESVFWQLIYDGTASHPWKKIGGPALFDKVSGGNFTSSDSYVDLGTHGPEITLPLPGDYQISIGMQQWDTAGWMSYAIGEIPASDNWGMRGNSNTVWVSEATEHKDLSAVLIKAKYRRSPSEGFPDFARRWMRVDPVRVG